MEPSDFFDETEPDGTVTNEGIAKVYFEGSDPVDAPEDLSYDCALDGGDKRGCSTTSTVLTAPS